MEFSRRGKDFEEDESSLKDKSSRKVTFSEDDHVRD